MKPVASKESIAIGRIANFFGQRYGKYNIDRLFKSLGIENIPLGNKIEKISCVLRHFYETDREVFLICMNTLIEYHKLEKADFLELRKNLIRLGYDIENGRVVSSIGKEIVFAEPKPYDAYKIIEEIAFSAKSRINIIDPYVDQKLVSLYFADVPPTVEIKLLTKNMYDKFKEVAKKFKRQRDNFEVKVSNEIHDRYLIVDNRAWMIGQSIKDAGEKPLSIVEIENVPIITDLFSKLWSESEKFL